MKKLVLFVSLVLVSVGVLSCYTPDINAEPKEDLVVFLMLGQSNGAYTSRANPDEVDSFVPNGHIYYYGNSENPMLISDWDASECGIYDMMETPYDARIGGIDQPLASNFYKLTGKDALVINCCVSGSKIVEWYPGTENYSWAQNCFADALSKVDSTKYNIEIGGLVWIQGESDPTWQIHAYKNRFNSIFGTMKHTDPDHSNFNEDYVFDMAYISLVRQYRGQNTVCSQLELCAQYTDIVLGCYVCDTFTYENGLLYNDNTHYTQKGRNIVGKDLAIAIAEEL